MSGTRNFLLDAKVPRPAPRIPINPTPFNFEKPVPQVPEVSLIFDSSRESNKPRSNSLSTQTLVAAQPLSVSQPQPTQAVQPVQPTNFEVRVLYDLIKKQEETISKLEHNVQKLSESQESQWKIVQSMLTTLIDRSSSRGTHRADQSIQTDNIEEVLVSKRSVTEMKTTLPLNSVQIQTETGLAKLPRVEKCRSSSSSSSSSSSVDSAGMFGSSSPLPEDLSTRNNNKIDVRENKAEDLSTILKDLQLPTIQENSIFSEVSIRSIDLQDYNDSFNDTKSDVECTDAGPSASNFGSSSDEEDAVKPTVTFYRNVIGNVNKMLEGNQEITMYGSTDTTVYGMSSTNLSFATKEYLQRYGLVKHREPPKDSVKPAKRKDMPNREPTSSNNNRILDMNALKNQPKFISKK